MNDEDKRDRQMLELLNELRVALPGVQFLLAFLLTVPFAQGFERITRFEKTVFYGALLFTAASVVFLIAPSATHRLRFHQRDRTFVIESANKYLIAGLVCLAIAIVLAMVMVTSFLYEHWIVIAGPAVIGLMLVVFWFLRPLVRG
ncbi:hypothetical protein DVA67_003960 [Solirubrobacter sp. CPCC 204708]|uniref:DUF6328 family protein n=1 Tax=Solirubrobacter deserti TaxID=2282478 RepID=A0ABT4RS01_9ACTN|nr:DUF6328 family protein [Solirubrobacter deserti]MBE2315114.1 hypothetical protein [Solirubrobacter deserti]MDA0141364.1 DUF6328 family protein [Solirubrobacter deserti]